MKNIPERVLEYNIGLVKYENPNGKNSFDLTTIHSLLIDQNPKFIQLKQLIANYNTKLARNEVSRPHMENSFMQRLYKLLSEVTRIPNSENQLKFLHVNLEGNNPISTISSSNFGTDRISVVATKPKKKIFEEILRSAEEKVTMETKEEIDQVKEKLIDNKIALGANRIYKSLSHHQPELLDGEFVGQILGQGMIKNPFFKVAKKKKKKKKK